MPKVPAKVESDESRPQEVNAGQDEDDEGFHTPRELPPDLPRSLDDRRDPPVLGASTEVYDAWQGAWASPLHVISRRKADWLIVVSEGQSRILTSPVPPTTFDFRLPLDSSGVDDESTARTLEDGENRLLGMLAAQVARRERHPAAGDEDGVALDESLPSNERRDVLQKALNMAASNGDVDRIRTLVGGRSASLLDINAPDEEGTAPLIYASCFVSATTHADRARRETDCARGIKKSSRRCSVPVPTSTCRIATSGVR